MLLFNFPILPCRTNYTHTLFTLTARFSIQLEISTKLFPGGHLKATLFGRSRGAEEKMGDPTVHEQENSQRKPDFLVLNMDALSLPRIKTTSNNKEAMDPFIDSRLHNSLSKGAQRTERKTYDGPNHLSDISKGSSLSFFQNFFFLSSNFGNDKDAMTTAVFQKFHCRPPSFRRPRNSLLWSLLRCKMDQKRPLPRHNRCRGDGGVHHLPGYILKKLFYSSLPCPAWEQSYCFI